MNFKKFVSICVPALCLTAGLASAQAGIDVFGGVGTMMDSSSGALVDTFGTGQTLPSGTNAATYFQTTGNPLFGTPRLGGTFGKFGLDAMFNNHFGVGGETDFRFSQGAYAGLTYRPVFYDFFGIYRPISRNTRVVPEFDFGLGGVNLRYYYAVSNGCDAFAGCSSSNQFLEDSNHFQARMGFGVAIYPTEHFFIKPQVDVHYVNNFYQFGSAWVPEYSVSLGYHFGSR